MAQPYPLLRQLGVALLAIAAWSAPLDLAAQQRLIRDVEIEYNLRLFADPIFEAARLDPQAVKIFLVEDPSVNAFVAGGMNIFLNTGLLLASREVGHLIGVIAHESGHIAGGHLVRVSKGAAAASLQTALAVVLGLGTAALSGNVEAGAGIMLGGRQAAVQSFLSFSREQETFADLAAVRYMNRAGFSPSGLLSFLEVLSQDEDPLTGGRSYATTHPLNRERIERLRYQAEHTPHYHTAFPANFEVFHQRIQAKVLGFLEYQQVLDGSPRLDQLDPAAQAYARAIAYYRYGDSQTALDLLDELMEPEPDYPFFHELKGEILFKTGQVRESLAPYRQAVRLLPDNALLRILLARTLIEIGEPWAVEQAYAQLTVARRWESDSSWLWELMAKVWDRKGDSGMRSYALAEEAMLSGDIQLALAHAVRATELLPENSPSRLRAEDIIYTITGR